METDADNKIPGAGTCEGQSTLGQEDEGLKNDAAALSQVDDRIEEEADEEMKVLIHVIDGFVIEEAATPFPVSSGMSHLGKNFLLSSGMSHLAIPFLTFADEI